MSNIVEYATILAHCDKEDSLEIKEIHESVEAWIKAVTGHDWISTSYTEFVDGTGRNKIQLKHYPVSAISRISGLETAIQIRNTATDATNAYVTVDSDSLDLTVTGGTSANTSSLAFSSYATLTTLIAAINALSAYSWDAAIYDSDFASVLSSNLMEVENFYCGSWNGITTSYQYLQMLGEPLSGLQLDGDIGEVYYSGGFVKGHQNYVAKYTAYASEQNDIEQAVKEAVKYLIGQREGETAGIKSYRTGDLSVTFAEILPASVLEIVKLHSKVT